jgi:D-hexose-6-phosphate mutarotase
MSAPSPLSRWSSPGLLEPETSPQGLLSFRLRTAAFEARFALQGAHLIEFTPSGQPPLLFLSQHSLFTPGKAIRGGIPIIFPWFGAHPTLPQLPMHGLVRTRDWILDAVEIAEDGSAEVRFRFESTQETLALWPYPFRLRLTFELSEDLAISWITENNGPTPFRFEQALHPYFPVHHAPNASVEGLQNAEYLDKTDAFQLKRDSEQAVHFQAETDRVYLDTAQTCFLKDPDSGRVLRLSKEGSLSTIVWNPWVEKAAALADLGDTEWPRFVCVEQGNANRNALELEPGKSHHFQVRYASTSVGSTGGLSS